jgi:hypothetical protein
MKRLAVLFLLGIAACGKQADRESRQPPARSAAVAVPMAPQSAVAGKPAPTKAAMIGVPEDKAQLKRLLAMGYTVHEDHLHPPGVKECPFSMGGSVVQ